MSASPPLEPRRENDPRENEARREFGELNELLEALCEDRLTPDQMRRIEELVLADRAALRHYLDYIALHGALLWDTAKSGGGVPAAAQQAARVISPTAVGERPRLAARGLRRNAVAVAVAVLAIVAGIGFLVNGGGNPPEDPSSIAGGGQNPAPAAGSPDSGTANVPPVETPSMTLDPSHGKTNPEFGASHGAGSNIAASGSSGSPPATPPSSDGMAEPIAIAEQPNDPVLSAGPPESAPSPSSVAATVAFVNEQIRAGWEAAGVRPSPRADDAEWLRRVHLDIVGRIPTPETVERFLKDRRSDKRRLMIDQLLDDPLYVRNWTTVWTNLLIGRSSSRDAVRSGLEKFLRESLALNRPWNDVAFDLVAAEGSPDENGAAGFLLAHLNNQAVPATAITARVLLGTQVQCTQCHNHPFNDAKQDEFWQLNGFFKETRRVERDVRDPASGEVTHKTLLVDEPVSGPIFFEMRSGLMRAAYPTYNGQKVDDASNDSRRRQLAKFIVEDEGQPLARAFVNRMWEHFFGAGFTRPVDDIGPHNQPTHPAVLDRLSDDFVKSGYDVKQLIRWICLTESYQLSSRFSEASADLPSNTGLAPNTDSKPNTDSAPNTNLAANTEDDPSIGNPPLFSRVYVKSMTAEQLYDSMLVATRADDTPRAARTDLDRQRHEWLQQFVVAYENEENTEQTTFGGTISQALMMMNSELVQTAVSREPGTYLARVLREDGAETVKIRRLCLAALSREPTPKEMAALRKMLREQTVRLPRNQSRELALAEGLQDIFWAFLNSNEFVLVH